MATPAKRHTEKPNSPFPPSDSFATVEPSGGKPDLFMLTSFDTTLPQREISEEELSIVFPEDDCKPTDLSKIRLESSEIRHRVQSFLQKLRSDPSPKSGSFHHLSDDLAALSGQIGRLSDVVSEKERELARVERENRLLQMKVRRLGNVAKRREERSEIELEEQAALPSCDLCTLF